jgi:4-amino-4-deoxy-L-arabinose transferase-like glycosyltransferase
MTSRSFAGRGNLIALGLLVACLAAEAGTLRIGLDDLDEGYFVQQAMRVVQGQVPFRDFETLYSPGLAYLHAALFSLLGGPVLMVPRTLSLLSRGAIVLLMYVLARPVVRQPFWAAAPGLFLLLGPDDAPERWEPHPGWLSTVFALMAAWCITRGPSLPWLVCAGLSAGATYLFKQNTGVFIMGAIVLWGLIAGRARLRGAAVPLAAFALFTAAWLVPLAIALNGNLSRLGVLVGAVNQASLFSPPELTIIVPIEAIVGGVWVLSRGSANPRLYWYLLAGSALFCTQYPRMDTTHLVWSTPLLLVVGAIVLDRLRPVVVVLAVLGLVELATPMVISRLEYVTLPRDSTEGVEAPAEAVRDVKGALESIHERTLPGDSIFVYPTAPLLYPLSQRTNPTRFDHLNPGAATSRQVEEIIADIQAANVQVVVVSDYWRAVWGDPGPNTPFEAWLYSHFDEVEQHGAYKVLVARI